MKREQRGSGDGGDDGDGWDERTQRFKKSPTALERPSEISLWLLSPNVDLSWFRPTSHHTESISS